MLSFALTLHILATVIWVGGMFFAHMALRPAANDLLEPPVRLPLLRRVLSGFFLWVWISVGTLLATGFWIFLGLWAGKAGLYVHIMMGIGLLMMVIFSFIYFVPYRKMGIALDMQNIAQAGAQMARVRGLIGINLVLGLVTTVIAVVKTL
jgi:uncharacterized membrane protein